MTECLKFTEKLQGRLTRPQQEPMDRGSGLPLIIPSASRCKAYNCGQNETTRHNNVLGIISLMPGPA